MTAQAPGIAARFHVRGRGALAGGLEYFALDARRDVVRLNDRQRRGNAQVHVDEVRPPVVAMANRRE